MGGVLKSGAARASLLTPLAGPSVGGPVNWNAWVAAALGAARAGIQRSIEHAYIGDGSVRPGDGSVMPGASLALKAAARTIGGTGGAKMGDGSVRPGAALLPAGALQTSYDFSADMQRTLVGGGMPGAVAAAFTQTTAETFYGWAASLSLGPSAGRSAPFPLSQATSTEQWRLGANAIEGKLREKLLLPATDPAASTALRQFAAALSSSLTRWQAGASLTKLSGAGVVAGPHV